jgi:tetratricopeptide (TPR) repeat protein
LGCTKKRAVVAPVPVEPAPAAKAEPAPPAVTPRTIVPDQPAPLEEAPLPKTITTPSSFDLGEMNFQVGNYLKAIKSFEAFLNSFPKAKNRDLALFHLGLSRALATDSSRDLRQSENALKRLISEFPNSRYKGQAEFILGLQSQIERLKGEIKDRDDRIKRLSEELQMLKDIDMQRRPSRPPE